MTETFALRSDIVQGDHAATSCVASAVVPAAGAATNWSISSPPFSDSCLAVPQPICQLRPLQSEHVGGYPWLISSRIASSISRPKPDGDLQHRVLQDRAFQHSREARWASKYPARAFPSTVSQCTSVNCSAW